MRKCFFFPTALWFWEKEAFYITTIEKKTSRSSSQSIISDTSSSQISLFLLIQQHLVHIPLPYSAVLRHKLHRFFLLDSL